MRRALLLCAMIVALFGVALALHPATEPWIRVRSDVRLPAFSSSRMFDAVMELDKLDVRADETVLELAPDEGDPEGVLVYSTSPAKAKPLPSTTLAAEELRGLAGLDVVSLAVDPRDWLHPEFGLKSNPLMRGRRWERGACLSFFKGGELALETPVGLRIHGDSSRLHFHKSYRVVMTPTYGTPRDAGRAFFAPPCGQILVLHADERGAKQFFLNPIAYELAASLGCMVPQTRPVRVVINGELLQPIYFATERVSLDYLRSRYGHANFTAIDERNSRNPKRYLVELARLGTGHPVSMRQLGRTIDLEQVTGWIVMVLISGCFDFNQGLAFIDRSDPQPRWRWIVWDLDWSFQPWPVPWPAAQRHGTFTDYFMHHRRELRCDVFKRLMEDDPAYRRYFFERLAAAVNHEVSQQRVRKLIDRYRDIARRYGGWRRDKMLASLDGVTQFLRGRPARVLSELEQYYAIPNTSPVDVIVPAGATVTIDGRPYSRSYSGDYFQGHAIRVQTSDARAVWEINGERVQADGALEWPIEEATRIRLVR